MNSVAGDYDYLELITNSKSGSFFFYSHDHKYIIKNMKVGQTLGSVPVKGGVVLVPRVTPPLPLSKRPSQAFSLWSVPCSYVDS